VALNSVPIIPRDGQLVISDNSGTPITLTVQYEDGDFSAGSFRQSNMSTQSFRDRGEFYAHRKVQEEEIEFSFSAHATDFTDATEKCLIDAFCKTGAFASGVSKLGSSADVWAVQIVFTAEQTNYGAGSDGTITLTYCIGEVKFSEGLPGKFEISGRAVFVGGAGLAFT
jgi:hypothetical protein